MSSVPKSADSTNPVYGTVAKALHWLIVAMLVMQYGLGWAMDDVHRDTQPVGLILYHLQWGLLVMAVVVIRLIWRLAYPVPLLTEGPAWQARAANITHWLLYALLLILPLIGWVNASMRGWKPVLYGIFPLPQIVATGSRFGRTIGEPHILLSYVVLGIAGLHIAAALYHHFLLRDGVLRRMLPRLDSATVMEGFAFPLPDFEPGWVWLAGAGPGDPGLLTLHVLNALRQADIVVYDALVAPPILKLARPGAQLENAGKRGGKPSPKQSDISLRLIDLARQGKRVLRLKGGDPMIFGRGAEEGLALAEAGIPFRILPGISAGIGALAYAGIPLTHRDTNSAVTFLTGHGANGLLPDAIDWPALAKSSPVIVLYMALATLPDVARALMAAGRSPAEPVAIVSHATLPEQSVIETTLEHAGEAAKRATPPALAVIGEVVRLRNKLDWFKSKRIDLA